MALADGPDGDAEVVARALADSEEALEEIAKRYWPRFYRVALGILSRPADAEDAAQDALIRLLERLSGFDPAKGAFASWAYRLAVNVAVDRLRERRRGGVTVALESVAPRSGGEDPARDVAEQETLELVRAAIAELPEQQRAVISLRDGEGRSTSEVASILSSTTGNVRAQLYHARKKVAARLASKGKV